MQTIWCGFPALHRCAPQRISGSSFPALSASHQASLESPRRSAHTASASHWPPASARGCCSLCWSAPMHSPFLPCTCPVFTGGLTAMVRSPGRSELWRPRRRGKHRGAPGRGRQLRGGRQARDPAGRGGAPVQARTLFPLTLLLAAERMPAPLPICSAQQRWPPECNSPAHASRRCVHCCHPLGQAR